MRVHGPRVPRSGGEVPYLSGNIFPRDHYILPQGQVEEQIKLLGSQVHRLAGHLHCTGSSVNLQTREADSFLLSHGLGELGAPQHGAHPRYQLPQADWLGHVVIRAHLQPHYLIHFRILAAEHDYGHGQLPPHAPTDVQAIGIGQALVQQQQMGRKLAQLVQPLRARECLLHAKALAPQHGGDCRLVLIWRLNQQNSVFVHPQHLL